jgi:hypothetical protein
LSPIFTRDTRFFGVYCYIVPKDKGRHPKNFLNNLILLHSCKIKFV